MWNEVTGRGLREHGLKSNAATTNRARRGSARGFDRLSPSFDAPRLVLQNHLFRCALESQARAQATNIDRLMLRAIRSLAHALEAKDPYTWGHSKRVSVYSVAIGCQLGLNEKEQATLALGGELHDVGKIGIPDTLLNKPAPLTADEYRDIMQHTVIGERILEPLLRRDSAVLGIVRWHHEHVSGGSLPDGLRSAEIPLEARIVSVADAFDAMTSERPYRPPMSIASALRELQLNAGSQFDESCVEACAAAIHDPLQALAS